MNFNDAALGYDESAFAQKRCAVELVKMLPNENIASFIDVGAGTGFASVEVLKKFPNAKAVLLDKSARMLEIAKTKIPCATTIIADAEVFDFSTYRCDLAIANLSLQWLYDLELFLQKIMVCAKYVAFSIPVRDCFSEYFNIFKNAGIEVPHIEVYQESEILHTLYTSSDIISYKHISITKIYDNAIKAAYHFKNIGATLQLTSAQQSKVSAILKSHKSAVPLRYELFLCVIRRKQC